MTESLGPGAGTTSGGPQDAGSPPPGFTGTWNGVDYVNGQPVVQGPTLPTTAPIMLPDASTDPGTTLNEDGTATYNDADAAAGGVPANTPVPVDSWMTPEMRAYIAAQTAAVAARNAQAQQASSAAGTAPGSGEGANVIQVPQPPPVVGGPPNAGLPAVPPPPAGPPAPPDIEGALPTTAPSRGRAFSSGPGQGGPIDETFQALIPRVAGNSVQQQMSPSDISGARPNVPAWMRGLARSPFARFLARGGQSSFSATPGFGQEDVPVDDPEARRLQELAGIPAWAQPTPGI